MGDAVKIADVLLEKTHLILNRLEQDWKEDDDQEGDKALEEIYKNLETYREFSAQSQNQEISSNQDFWRQELMKSISNLKRELEEIKTVHPIVKCDLDMASNRTSVKKSTKRGKNHTELKSNLKETERIMNRGFKTARELNEKLELLRKKRDCKETEVQVSPMSSKSAERSCDNDSYIRGLVEDVTSLLVQQDVRNSAKNQRVNTRNLVIRGQDERPIDIPRGRRLVVQKLPDNHIRTPLTVQTLPSVDIPPASVTTCAFDNTGIFLIKHETVQKSKSVSSRATTSSHRKNEIGVQAELSERSKNDSLEKLILALGQKYKEENIPDDSGKLNELFKNVRSSREQCQQLRDLSLAFKSSSPKLVKSQTLSEDEYKSDFEVESIVQDSHTKSSLENHPLVKRDMSLLSSKTNSLSEDESQIELQMKRLGLSIDRVSGKNSKRSLKPADRKLYVKKNGKYVAVDHVDSPRVQIIVPEIVVRLPEAVNPDKQTKQDQLIQTDEGFATLTSVDTSSVVKQLHKRFERTELLLERIGGRDFIGDELLGLLRRRSNSSSRDGDLNLLQTRGRRHTKEANVDFAANEESEFFNSFQSIGEVLNGHNHH